jgi:flagellar export protein FliJ
VSAAFAFRLARVLRHRERLEDARARELREAAARHAAARERHAAITRATDAALVTLVAHAGGGVAGAWLRVQADAVHDLRARGEDAAALSVAEAALVAHARTALVDAARERRALENLRGIRHAAWQAHTRHVEQRENDEIALRRVTGASMTSERP